MWPGLRPTFVPSGILIHSRLAATDMGRKVRGLLCPLLDRGAGSPSNTLSPGRRPRPTSLPSGILIYPAVWPQQTWAENWGCILWGRESWVPIWHNVARAEAYTSMSGFILTHSTVWPKYTNVTDSQVQTDRQRSDRTGRTVLQTVVQKRNSILRPSYRLIQ